MKETILSGLNGALDTTRKSARCQVRLSHSTPERVVVQLQHA